MLAIILSVFLLLVYWVGMSAGIFGGLLACNYFGLGFGFGDLKKDVLRCVMAAVVFMAVLLLVWVLLNYVLALEVVTRGSLVTYLAAPFAAGVAIKLFWLEDDISGVEVVIALFSGMLVGLFFFGLGTVFVSPLLRIVAN